MATVIEQLVKRAITFLVIVAISSSVLYTVPELSSLNTSAQIEDLAGGYLDWWSGILKGEFLVPKVTQAIPWTLALMGISTVVSFATGSIAGALIASPIGRIGTLTKLLTPIALVLYATPFFVLGMVLIWLFVWLFEWFPSGGGYTFAETPQFTWRGISTLIWHGTLPSLSIIVTGIAQWLILMRAMMVTTGGEEYVTLSRAMGLKPWRILAWYQMRNCALPQITHLFLSLGIIFTGAVIVEIVFSYPGVGYVLQQAIIGNDLGTVRSVVITTSLVFAGLLAVMDALYPVIDRRISRS